MKFVKMLTTAAVALMAFVPTASATTLTSSEGTTYTGEIVARSFTTELDGAFVTVKCGYSETKGTVEVHGAGVNAGGKLSSLTFTECNYTTTVKNAGSLSIDSSEVVRSTGAEVSIATSVGTCVFTTNNTFVGVLTDGPEPILDIWSAKIPRTAGNFLCGSSGTWTGGYTVTTPKSLWVD